MTEINQNNGTIPYLKADALVDVTIGAGFVERVQKTLLYLMEGHEEDLKTLDAKKEHGASTQLTPWENAVITQTMLLQDIMINAEKNGSIEYVPITKSEEELKGLQDQ